jgi:site-specific recombinase XerD
MKERSARDGGYKSLFNNKSLKRWYDNVSRGSYVTADVYLRRLGHLCNDLKKTPQELVEMKEEQLYELCLDIVSRMEQEGRSGSYIQSQLKAVKSWLLHNRIEVRGTIKIRGVQDTPTLKDERVPTKPELKRIFLAGDEKTRVACAFIAHAGLRPEALGHYRGNDGLRMRDLPDLSVENQTVEFLKVPTMVIVRRELSKAGHQYFTFLTEEACSYLKDYLDMRTREGEALDPDSAIVTPKQRIKPFIRTSNIGDTIRNSIRKAGFPWRPYVLRSYFDTQLMLAESKGLVMRDYRQFWMGHKGDIENRYTTNKQRLPESVVEDMRAAYERSQDFLQTKEKESTSEEKLRDSFRKQLLLVAGLSQEEVDKLDLSSISDEELQSLVRKKLLGVPTPDSTKQKVVTVDEANGYLAKGWEYVAKVSNNRVIIKMSQSTGV